MATVDQSPADNGYGSPYIDSLILGTRWSGTITWSFGTTAGQSWSAAEQAAFRLVFSLFEQVSDIDFEETTAADANFVEFEVTGTVFGDTPGGSVTLADHHYPGTDQGPNGADAQGRYNVNHSSWSDVSQGGMAFSTIVHEIGHGVGLEHPHDGDELFPGVERDNAFGDLGDNGMNQAIWTIMSYNRGWNGAGAPNNAFGHAGGLMALDIAALQELYGTDWSFNSGDNLYLLPTTNASGTYFLCIWDGGGIDTISNAGTLSDTVIDLRPAPLTGANAGGYVSRAGGVLGGFTIANKVVIEAAIGGGGNDTITGNDAANTIEGGAGADSLAGGDGKDIVSYASSTGGVRVDLGRLDTEPPSGGHAAGDTLSGFEGLIGGSGNDWLGGVGNVGGSYVDGGKGADTVFAGDDHDTLRGGLGADLLQGNGGADTLYGADSDLILNGGFEVVAGPVVKPDGWTEYVNPLDGWGLQSGPGRELFTAGTGVAPIEGRFGIDLEGSQINSNIAITQQVTRAEDGVRYRLAFEARKLNDGVDARLEVYWGGQKLNWGGSGDHIAPSTTLLTYYIDVFGGAGEAAMKNRLSFVEVGGGDTHGTLLDNVRMYRVAEGTAKAEDADPFNDGGDVFNPGAGSDAVFGHGGDDTARFDDLVAGSDHFDGGSGTDLMIMDWSASTAGIVHFDLHHLNSPAIGAAEYYRNDVLGNVFLYFSQVEIFQLTGGSGFDELRGGALADTLIGNAGDDTLVGGGGADDLRGGDGFDRAFITLSGSGNNVINLAAITGGGSATLADGTRLSSIEAISLEAGEGNDLIDVRGSVAAESGRTFSALDGKGGNDTVAVDLWTSHDATLAGGVGTDLLILDWSASTYNMFRDGEGHYRVVYQSGHVNGSYYELAYDALFSGFERYDITTGAANDQVFGGDGDDRVRVIGGRDSAALGAGSDLLVVDWTANDFHVGHAIYEGAPFEGTLAAGYSGTYGRADDGRHNWRIDFSGVERFHVSLGGGNDAMRTGDGADTVSGGAGNDHLITAAGIDIIDGGAGNDRWEANKSAATDAQPMVLDLTQAGVQASYMGTGVVSGIEMLTLITGAGNDAIRTLGAEHDDQLTTGEGADTVTVAGGRDTAALGAGSDLLVVDWTANNFHVGHAIYEGAPFEGTLAAGYSGTFGRADDGRHNWRIDFSGVERFRVSLGGGNDAMRTGDGADTVSGGAGNDHLITAAGVDIIDGGAGDDRWEANKSAATGAQPIVLDLTQTGTQASYMGTGVVSGIEMLTLITGAGNDAIRTLGVWFDDQLTTGEGADTVTVAGGRDSAALGAGSDLLVVDWTANDFHVGHAIYEGAPFEGTLAAGYSGTFGRADDGRHNWRIDFSGVERFRVSLGGGNDAMRTGDGADTVSGGAGNDHLITAAGIDIIDGGAGNDRWEANKSAATDAQPMVLDLTQAGVQASYMGTGVVSGIEMLSLVTGAGHDAIRTLGAEHDDQLTTGEGADTVTVAGGRDTAALGAGSDLLVVDWTANNFHVGHAIYEGAPFEGTLAAGYSGTFGRADDGRHNWRIDFSGVERFQVSLGGGNDAMRTGDGADTVNGGAGNDHLITAAGVDIVDGGAGEDRWTADKSGATGAQPMVLDLTQAGTQASYMGTGVVSGIEMLTLITGAGNDAIRTLGVWFDDQLTTGEGNDSVTVAGGRDNAALGAGSDLLVVDWAANDFHVGFAIYEGAPFEGSLATGYSGTYGRADDGRYNWRIDFSGVERFRVSLGAGNDAMRTGDGADTVSGGAGNDHLITGAGADSVNGGAGEDRWTADKSAATAGMIIDLTVATASTYLIDGVAGAVQGIEALGHGNTDETRFRSGGGNDRIATRGEFLSDFIDASGGDDRVEIRGGRDVAHLGAGADLLLVDWTGYASRIQPDGYEATAFTGTLATGYAGTYGEGDARYGNRIDFSGVERFEVRLGLAADLLVTGDGADTVLGADGDDHLITGKGADSIDGGSTTVAAVATRGADRWTADKSDATLGMAINLLSNARSTYVIDGVAGAVQNIEALGHADADGARFASGAGADTITTRAEFLADFIETRGGHDIVDIRNGRDAAHLGAGTDTLLVNWSAMADRFTFFGYSAWAFDGTLATGHTGTFGTDDARYGARIDFSGVERFDITLGSGNDHIRTGDGADRLAGGAGDDVLAGFGGADTIDGGTGADSMNGDLGNDLYLVDHAGDLVADAGGADTVSANVSHTLAAGVELLRLLGGGIDGAGNAGGNTLLGTAGANSLDGLAGNDLLDGGAAGDTLSGGAGGDTLDGGLGNDLYLLEDPFDVVLDSGGADTISSTTNRVLIDGIEALLLAGSAANGTGNALDNRIQGNAANNLLNGGLGADTLLGGAGNDTYTLDAPGDVVTEAFDSGTDQVSAGFTYALGAHLERLLLTGTGDFSGTGNQLDNAITGNNGANNLVGGGGADSLVGSGGADTLAGGTGADTGEGGQGNDRYIIDSVLDIIIETATGGRDEVVSAVSWTLGDHLETLRLSGAGGLVGVGNALGNQIVGNLGADSLDGGAGNDILSGGDGADTIAAGAGLDRAAGGAGADRFLWRGAAEGLDQIQDFVRGEDLLLFEAAGFGLAPGAVGAANFVAHASSGASAPAGTPQFIYNTANGLLLFDADGAGGAAAARIASFIGKPAIATADFLLL